MKSLKFWRIILIQKKIVLLIFLGLNNLQAQEIAVLREKGRENPAEMSARAEALNAQGIKAADAGKMTEAVKLFQEAIRLRSDYAVAYGNLGKAFYYTGQFSEAITALKKAISLNSVDAEVYNNLGIVYFKIGKTDEAIRILKRAVELKPDIAITLYSLANVYVKLRRFRQALPLLEQAVKLDPNDAEIRWLLGYTWRHLKKYNEAIKEMQEAVRLKPENSDAQLFLGQLYLLNGDKQSALTHYRNLLAFDPQTAQKLYESIYAKFIVNAAEKSSKSQRKD